MYARRARLFIFALVAYATVMFVGELAADACGVKLSLKATSVRRAAARSKADRSPRRTSADVRQPIRVRPRPTGESRAPVATGGGATQGAAVAAGGGETPAESSGAAVANRSDEETEESPPATDRRQVATRTEADTTADAERETPKVARARVARRIFFGNSSATLAPRSREKLVGTARWLQRHGNRSVVVEGHANVTGAAAPNHALSEARAQAVKEFLVEQGVDGSRITTEAFGMTRPEYEPGYSGRNRRVVIKVTP